MSDLKLASAGLIAALLTAAAVARQAQPAEPEPAAEQAAADSLREDVRRVVEKVERMRGGKVSAALQVTRASAAERAAVADAAASAWADDGLLDTRGQAWADLGLADRRAPARLAKRLALDLEAAVLDGSGNRVLVSEDILTDRDFLSERPDETTAAVLLATGVRPDEPVIAHLAVHALQRARDKGQSAKPMTTDALLARAAWHEGEANLLAIGLLFEGLRLAEAVLQPGISPSEVLDGRLVPAELSTLPAPDGAFIDFVYQEGYEQAVRAFRGGGFRALDQAARARVTTRDVLHTDRSPLPPADERTPALAPLEDAFDAAGEDSLGEMGVFALVSGRTGKDDLALAAADGWQDDRLIRWEPAAGSKAPGPVTVWETHWASEAEAADFSYAVGRVAEDGFGGVALTDTREGRRSWSATDRVFRVHSSGRNVSVRVAGHAADAFLESGGAPPLPNQPPKKATK